VIKEMGLPPTMPSSRRLSFTWPVILIALGVIFLLEEFVPHLGFRKTWPVLLVVVGILKLIDSARPPRPPEGPRL
jgi:hypothetical protein